MIENFLQSSVSFGSGTLNAIIERTRGQNSRDTFLSRYGKKAKLLFTGESLFCSIDSLSELRQLESIAETSLESVLSKETFSFCQVVSHAAFDVTAAVINDNLLDFLRAGGDVDLKTVDMASINTPVFDGSSAKFFARRNNPDYTVDLIRLEFELATLSIVRTDTIASWPSRFISKRGRW